MRSWISIQSLIKLKMMKLTFVAIMVLAAATTTNAAPEKDPNLRGFGITIPPRQIKYPVNFDDEL